ncbi:MAG: peptidylprolyl isomerase [Methylophilaceae bacterium]
MRNFIKTALTLFVFTCTLSAYAGDEIVAKLGNTELRQSQVKAILDSLDATTKKQLLSDPAAFAQVVRTELIRRVILKEANDKQWDKRPEVKSQIDIVRDQVIVSAYMNDTARPATSYPSDDEVKQAYEANKASFLIPTQYHLAQIYLSSSADNKSSPEEAEKKANDLASKAKGPDFAELANKNSDHKESAAKGGDIGWLAEADMIPELRVQILKLSAGQVSKPIKSPSGWHIIKLLEIKPSSTQALKDAKEVITSSLRLQKAKQLEQQYIENMLKSQQMSINEIAMGELLK